MFPIRKHEKESTPHKRKKLDQIENSSYEVVRFQGTVPVSSKWTTGD
ncbi:hypothetical protein BT246_63140 (plasmid) [Bacillus thuringiensis]|uniref:Uncharacterized protein n=1 Tax=Bacillus thuringiensis TaxID=1428 RepID=A0A9W3SH92_BACTU|nr:hypothetical protein BT246_63140 [Bacillus thuringiensis]